LTTTNLLVLAKTGPTEVVDVEELLEELVEELVVVVRTDAVLATVTLQTIRKFPDGTNTRNYRCQ
jgi:hypothetical protein